MRILVLAGTGKTFCSGVDRREPEDGADKGFNGHLAEALSLSILLKTLRETAKPTIARVHGPVLDAGIGLVAACDMVVASYEAAFRLGEVRLGQIPAVIAPYLIQTVGERAARRYALSAEPFTAAEAFRLGLVTDIVPPEELDGRINALLGQLIQGSPSALSAGKAWFRAAAGTAVTEALIQDGAARHAALCATEEARAGLEAHLKRRKPPWLSGIGRAAAKSPPGRRRPR